MKQDYYKTLGVIDTAELAVIKSSVQSIDANLSS
jgi:DnaJ-class molecular chaperone